MKNTYNTTLWPKIRKPSVCENFGIIPKTKTTWNN